MRASTPTRIRLGSFITRETNSHIASSASLARLILCLHEPRLYSAPRWHL